MKLLILALSFLSMPAFGEGSPSSANQEADVRVCLGDHNFGVCVGPQGYPGYGHPGYGPGYGHPGYGHPGYGPGYGHPGYPGPGYGHPGYPGYPGYPGPGYGPGYGSDCVAQNDYGYRFQGFGRWVNEAQSNALDNCYRSGSRYCRVIWCR